jgi:hypothetical protein
MTFIDLTGSNRSQEPGPAAPEDVARAGGGEPPHLGDLRAAVIM